MEKPTKEEILDFIDAALKEDVGDGDHTSLACIPAGDRSRAKLLIKDDGILAGVELAKDIFAYVDPTSKVDVKITDGTHVEYGQIAFEVECYTQSLLKAERLILNAMQRMSGVATMVDRFKAEIEGIVDVHLLDTRKTTPLLRFLEKWAVRIGGGMNYRQGLYDWIMIKDNHIDACGSITKAVEKVHEYLSRNEMDLKITVEVRNLVELDEVLAIGGVHRIMLDNFEVAIMREAVATIAGRFETEASGGVNLYTVRDVAKTGVDFISIGALTHSFESLDLSLKVIKE